MSQPEPPSQGLVAGKYQLVRLIGRGGMGSVWEARHVTLGTTSAVKFIESEYADSHEARSRFDKEAKAAATIQSKHATQIFDHGVTDDGKPYIVMELLEGEPLDKRIDRYIAEGRTMSVVETATILQQVCRGLARAHERGIIHRDLKPENIFIVRTPDDDEEVAKVLDFGIAKIQSTPGIASATSSTKTGAVLGTPFYMSPEQARGLRSVDHRTDVWSLGVIAFKCVTGTLPFDGESVGDLLVKICTAPVPVPSQVAPDIPHNFDAWFMRALEREPERRFASVTELADALCFAAGIAVRSGRRAPIASIPTVGSAGGGYASAGAPRTATPRGSFADGAIARGASSQPGAMTNAPFTSESVPGVPAGRGKLVMGGILAGIAAIAATVGVLFALRPEDKARSEATNGIVVAPPPVVEVSANPEPKAAATTSEPSPTPNPAPTAESPTRPSSKPIAPAKPIKTTAPPHVPATVTVPTSATATTPSTAPPSPKKPNKHDPGY